MSGERFDLVGLGEPMIELNQTREIAALRSGDLGPPPTPTALDPDFPNDPIFRDTRQWWLRNAGPGSSWSGCAAARWWRSYPMPECR